MGLSYGRAGRLHVTAGNGDSWPGQIPDFVIPDDILRHGHLAGATAGRHCHSTAPLTAIDSCGGHRRGACAVAAGAAAAVAEAQGGMAHDEVAIFLRALSFSPS